MDEDLRLLIVDDDEVDRMAIRRTLKQSGLSLEVREAPDAATAMAILTEEKLDWILLDFHLPDLDGLTLIQRLRKSGIHSPLIVLTGHGDEQTAVELMKAGASDYLAKSQLSPATLAKRLQTTLKLYRAEQQAIAARHELEITNTLLRRQNQELEQQRQQIEQQNLELLEAYQIKSEFLATMSHELRTPLNAIMGFSQILNSQTKGPLNGYQEDMVRRIFNNGQHLLELVNDILDFSKIEARGLTLQSEKVNVQQLILSTLGELQSLARKKGLELQSHFCLSDPILCNDAKRLRQVLINLLSNAVKFTDTGYVRVEAWESEGDEDFIEISVQDTGIGIAADSLPSIFNAFHQIDQSNRRRYSGTGLGLAITRSLVNMMGGTIAVRSVVGEGSTFHARIPRHLPNCTGTDDGQGGDSC